MSSFGERLFILRKARDLTQEQLGDEMGVTNGAVSAWERNVNQPDHSTTAQLASFFGVSTDWLLGKSDSEEPIAPEQKGDAEVSPEDFTSNLHLFIDALKQSEIKRHFAPHETVDATREEAERVLRSLDSEVAVKRFLDRHPEYPKRVRESIVWIALKMPPQERVEFLKLLRP